MSRIIFLDTETTGLDPAVEEIFELAIVDSDGIEYVWTLEPSLSAVTKMHPKAAEVNRYHQRTTDPSWTWSASQNDSLSHWKHVLDEIHEVLNGAHIVGAVPDFDTRFLTSLYNDFGRFAPRWNHHLICVETLLIGWLLGRGEPMVALPWKSDDLSRLAGITPPDLNTGERHTALADTRWVKTLFEHVQHPIIADS